MAYESRRTLVVGCAALAVVLSAALFPAAGLGTHPGGEVAAPGTTVPDRTPTDEPGDDPASTESVGGTDPEETPTDTPSPTPIDTPVPGDRSGGGFHWPNLSLLALLGALARATGLTMVGLGVVSLLLVVRGVQPGTPHVVLPFGYTITLPFAVPEWVGRLTPGVSRLTMGFVVSLSASVTQLLDALGAALRATASALGIVGSEGLRGTLRLLGALPRAVVGLLGALTALPAALAALPGALATLGGSVAGASERPDADARAMAPEPDSSGTVGETGPASVEDAWLAMTDLLPVERGPTTTPTEFARRAVDRGVPAAPVRRLTRAFEDVVYGGYSPGEHVEAAREALVSLRERLGGDA